MTIDDTHTMPNHDIDTYWMQLALTHALRGKGRTAENPSVGCMIVRDNQLLAAGHTALGGRPHAERQAIHAAPSCHGATLYVTLEPCAHHGRTPPCVEAIIAAGITRVVIGCQDADSRVAGKGIALLQQAGIEVTCGVMQEAALQHHAGFLQRFIEPPFPAITVKIATSADEKITTGNPAHPWITGAQARAYGQLLRSQHQAIVTAIGTVLADDPMLTCRLQGLEYASPLRVVLDRQLRMPLTAQLVTTAQHTPTLLLTSHQDALKIHALQEQGVEVAQLATDFSFADAMEYLACRGIHEVMIEGGQRLTHAALASGLAHRFYWFRAPHYVVGKAGLPALPAPESLQDYTPLFTLQDTLHLGEDRVDCYRC